MVYFLYKSITYMSTAALKLYDLLIDKGFDRAEARDAVDEILTKEEARQTLVTKDDLHKQTMWMAGLLIGQIAINTGILAVFFSIYS